MLDTNIQQFLATDFQDGNSTLHFKTDVFLKFLETNLLSD